MLHYVNYVTSSKEEVQFQICVSAVLHNKKSTAVKKIGLEL